MAKISMHETAQFSLANSLQWPPLTQVIAKRIVQAGGWLGFEEFMSMALYTPELGYYARGDAPFGLLPYVWVEGQRVAGSDFATAPEISPLFGKTLARQVAQALAQTQTHEVWEFGAGSGALALQLLQALETLGQRVTCYHIVDLSGRLRAQQQRTLAAYADVVQWASVLPPHLQGVVLGNELLDAMPVTLLARVQGTWLERGVALAPTWPLHAEAADAFIWQDRPSDLRLPADIAGTHDYLSELHLQGEAFVRTLADKLTQGAIFLLDYGFSQAEYYHPQRHMGTVMCHSRHQSDTNPLQAVGEKDITAHVNFSGIALAAQEAGLGVLGYCTQGRFLLNCGLADELEKASLTQRVMAQKLVLEHEMGELFKVIGLHAGAPWLAMGFACNDKSHTL